jgi:putative transcriptional regulator
MPLAAGQVLVAAPSLTDPNFAHAVLFLVEHGAQGSLAFIVNRPLDHRVGEIWEQAPAGLTGDGMVAEGGPVDRTRGLLLHGDLELLGAHAIAPGVAVGGDLEALAARWPGGPDYLGPRLYLGHSGWAPGQLQGEIDDGAWLLRAGDPAVLWQPPLPELWQRLVRGRSSGPSLN